MELRTIAKRSKEKYYVYLDDYRPAPTHSTHEWVVSKSYDEFKKMILTRGVPYYISFDHDLNDNHYKRDYSDHKTGLDCIKYLIQVVNHLKCEPPFWGIHTMNVERLEPMSKLLREAWPHNGRSYNDI